MSSTPDTTFTSSNFETLLDAALTEYTEQTGIHLLDHPLTSKIDGCDDLKSILDIFGEQTQKYDGFSNGSAKLSIRVDSFVIEVYRLERSIPKMFRPTNAVLFGVLILLSVRVSFVISAPILVTFRITRWPCMRGQVTTPWSISLTVWVEFSEDIGFIPFQFLPRRLKR